MSGMLGYLKTAFLGFKFSMKGKEGRAYFWMRSCHTLIPSADCYWRLQFGIGHVNDCHPNCLLALGCVLVPENT